MTVDRVAPTSGRSLLSNSVALSAARMLPMGFGFCSWLLAARAFPATEVGLASAAVAAALLGVQLALMGLGTATVSRLPTAPRPREFLDATFFALTTSSAVVGGALLLLARTTGAESARAVATLPHASLFVALVVTSTLAFYVDHAFVALRQADRAVVRGLVNALVVLAGIAAGAWLDLASGLTTVLCAWVAGATTSLLVGCLQLRRSSLAYTPGVRTVDARLLRQLVRAGASHHAVNVTERAPGLLLPVLVTELLSPSATAAWYAVWMIASGVYLVPASVGLAVQAEAADPAAEARPASRGVRYSILLGGAAAVAVLAVSAPLLTLLGEAYAAAHLPLLLLLPAVAPVAVVQVYLAHCRASERIRAGIALNVAGGAAVLVLAAVGAVRFGLVGVAGAWLVTQSLCGAWCWRALPRLVDASTRTPGGLGGRAAAAAAVDATAP